MFTIQTSYDIIKLQQMKGEKNMYLFKEELDLQQLLGKKTITQVAEEVGIARSQVSQILNAKRSTTKPTAYYISKVLNEDFEVQDLFNRVNESVRR